MVNFTRYNSHIDIRATGVQVVLCNVQAAEVSKRLGTFEVAVEPSMAAEDFGFLAGVQKFHFGFRGV